MKPPCELAVKEFLPSLRAAIVRELSESYHMKQTDIADILGITQASVSQYLNIERAKDIKFKMEGFNEMVAQMAKAIVSDKTSRTGIVHSMCALCAEVRKSEEFCKMHQLLLHVEECDICKT